MTPDQQRSARIPVDAARQAKNWAFDDATLEVCTPTRPANIAARAITEAMMKFGSTRKAEVLVQPKHVGWLRTA